MPNDRINRGKRLERYDISEKKKGIVNISILCYNYNYTISLLFIFIL